MIKKHEFNTKWLGYNSGIITEGAFFSLQEFTVVESLNEYQFVEARIESPDVQTIKNVITKGFWQVDTQIRFTLDLGKLKVDPYVENNLCVQRASDKSFLILQEDIYPFKSERFLILPGVDQKMVDERYLSIIKELIQNHPQWALQITHKDQIQGWYFGVPKADGIELTLAMLHKNATIKGRHLYHKAISIFAADFALAQSRFSIKNTSVHNILSNLGARFLESETVWFWYKH